MVTFYIAVTHEAFWCLGVVVTVGCFCVLFCFCRIYCKRFSLPLCRFHNGRFWRFPSVGKPPCNTTILHIRHSTCSRAFALINTLQWAAFPSSSGLVLNVCSKPNETPWHLLPLLQPLSFAAFVGFYHLFWSVRSRNRETPSPQEQRPWTHEQCILEALWKVAQHISGMKGMSVVVYYYFRP